MKSYRVFWLNKISSMSPQWHFLGHTEERVRLCPYGAFHNHREEPRASDFRVHVMCVCVCRCHFFLHVIYKMERRTCGERLLPMAGLTVLVCADGLTKLSEYPEKPWRPEDRQYAELPSWDPAVELSPLWCTEVGGSGCGLWTVLGCSDAVENQTFLLNTHMLLHARKLQRCYCETVSHSCSYQSDNRWWTFWYFKALKKCKWLCSDGPTLGYGGWRVWTVGQLVGLQAWHSWRRETTRDEVVESHQLIGSGLFPPPGSSVAEPHLGEEQKQECLLLYSSASPVERCYSDNAYLYLAGSSVHVNVYVCVCVWGPSDLLQGAELIEILTSGACSETTDITSLCATTSHWVQITPEGCFSC